MGHMAALDRLHVLDAYEFADHAGMDGLVHCPEIRTVAEHVADSYDMAVFVGLFRNVSTLFLALGHRLLEEYIISPLKSFHTWLVVGVVRSCDDYGVSKLRNGKDLTPVPETMLLRDIELVSGGILSRFTDIGHADYLHALRIFLGIIGICASSVAGTDDDYLYRAVLDIRPQSLYREIHFRVRSR